MNPQEYREFLTQCLADYDNYLQECIAFLQSSTDRSIAAMTNDDKKRYLIECRNRFIEACVTAYEDNEQAEHIDG